MIGLFWNIRGLGKIERLPALINRTRSTRADFVHVMETKSLSLLAILGLLLVMCLLSSSIFLPKSLLVAF